MSVHTARDDRYHASKPTPLPVRGEITLKKLLFQLDTDTIPSIFDTVVAYDGGADHVHPLSGMSPETCQSVAEGAIYTRPPAAKKNTAIFIGGSDMSEGEALMTGVRKHFFSKFRVSVMLDSNGGNTTAAAAVALLANAASLDGKSVLVLAGTGPVGSRAAALFAKEGARVRLASREIARANEICDALAQRFDVSVDPVSTGSAALQAAALDGAHVVLSAGKAGVQLLDQAAWEGHDTLEMIADVSTAPPPGIEGLELTDRDTTRANKRAFGGLGIGALKLRVHRACIERLFESNDAVLDAEDIYAIARELIGNG